MRLSQMLFVTLRESPAEAEIPSHKLLLRAGYIRRIGSGVYAYLPLLWRVLQKVSAIVRAEMNATGATECLLPQIQPAELWQESGRWDTYTKAEGIMFALTDRQGRQLGLGPTHEEVITAVARDMIRSYRQLPLHLYQIQSKFRDEIRPRFGLMRGREFIMKDGYSFHPDTDSLKKTYQEMYQAYSNILTRCGLTFRAVEADSGAIGGAGSHEFMVLADAGEDEVLYTADGNYAANVEKAISRPTAAIPSQFTTYEERPTPGTDTIEKLVPFLPCHPSQVVKNILYEVTFSEHEILLVLVSIRGDQEINLVKLQNALSQSEELAHTASSTIISIKLSDEDDQNRWATKPLPVGYIGPDLYDGFIRNPKVDLNNLKNLLKSKLNSSEIDKVIKKVQKQGQEEYSLWDIRANIRALGSLNSLSRSNAVGELDKELGKLPRPRFIRVIDETAVDLKNFITGANKPSYHIVGANWNVQYPLPQTVVDVRKAQAGDLAVHDPSQTLQSARGIEIGHIFQLGTKYSQALGATYTAETGEEIPLVMGCYGIGVSRLAQAAVEQSYDKDGIIWPLAIAPYQAIVVIPNISDAQQVEVATQLYEELNAAGIETLLDDRDERAGVKFKDADLIGIPFRIVTGRALAQGKVEVVKRASKESEEIAIKKVVETLGAWCGKVSA
ncbi:proline--tRNA ligase [Thermosynechococcaceae cyanobacterium BACA0444]|uniref:Proline--tRNA ligase n=1 Tax=Pseudocalidococcus azoricus BACA0444 TaxID=2918990 RepID=A0AAE4FQF9_9CYAN|nr:proline--tRNA ligase [Pseudocalidococcus azoricus]MDS3860281.1 proline--tRNA ligase [Pseudocalidococcus azoricus BACA0444]